MNIKEYMSRFLRALRLSEWNPSMREEGSSYRTEYRWWFIFSGLPETRRQFKEGEKRVREIAKKYGIDPNKSLKEIYHEFIRKCSSRSEEL